MTAAAYEFDDCPGPVRELISQTLRELRKTLARAVHMAIEAGQLSAETDPDQLAFEICGIYAGAQLDARLFGDPQAWQRALVAFENLINRPAGGSAPAQPGMRPPLAAAKASSTAVPSQS